MFYEWMCQTNCIINFKIYYYIIRNILRTVRRTNIQLQLRLTICDLFYLLYVDCTYVRM